MRYVILAALVLAPAAWAQVPPNLEYQGRLMDEAGAPRAGIYSFTFAVFDGPSAGSLVWCETHSVGLSDGYYSAHLGEGAPCATPSATTSLASAFAAPSRYLELSVDGAPLSPRQPIASVPFAFVAASIANGGASFIQNQTAANQTAGFRISGTNYVTGPAPFTATGTVATVSGTATVTGNGTAFDKEVVIGDLITINVPDSQSQHVIAISDATHLTVDGNWRGTTNNLNFQIQKVVAQLNAYSVTAGAPAALLVNQGGNVGIGTNNPRSKLEVVGGVQLGRSSGVISENWWEFGLDDGKTGTGIDFHGGSGVPYSDYTARLYRVGGNAADFIIVNRGGGSMQLQTEDASRVTIASNGNVGIGTTSPAQQLHVAGRAYFEAAGVGINTDWNGYPSLTVYRHRLDGADNATSYPELRIHGYPDTFIGANTVDWSVNLRIDGATYFSSDRRRKVNIEAVPNALTRVLALRGTHFNTITPTGAIEVNRNSLAPDGRRMGFIAQEVAQVVPEAVNYYAEADRPNAVGFADAYSVDYGALTALLVEAVKGLDSQNHELRQEAARCTQASSGAASLATNLEASLKAEQKKIDAQQARLDLQEAQIARLEALVAKLGAR